MSHEALQSLLKKALAEPRPEGIDYVVVPGLSEEIARTRRSGAVNLSSADIVRSNDQQ